MGRIIALSLLAGATLLALHIDRSEAAEMTGKDQEQAQKIVQTAGRDRLGDFAPDFARYNDDILFGEVWSRNDILSLHDRSIVTICALVGGGVLDSSLKYHIQSAKKNGVTKAEMVEIITQLGFYAGWPKAWAVFPMAQEVYAEEAEDASEGAIPDLSIFPIGEKNEAYAKYFDGQSWLSVISKEQVSIANVTFEPGCRNHWHVHRAKSGGGQMLVVTAGRGWYQERGEPARELHPGDVVHIPANVEHWHGAAKDSWFQHLAIEVPGEGTSTEWCEPVSVEGYEALR